ncbi:MAG: YrrC family ATP-dependent DNA helicase, partial [Verrucomicrobiales bacterium]
MDRVSYFNEESGFAVLRVQLKSKRELVTVVGALPAANAGEWLTAEGVWVRD